MVGEEEEKEEEDILVIRSLEHPLPHITGESAGRIRVVPKNQKKLKSNALHIICFNCYF